MSHEYDVTLIFLIMQIYQYAHGETIWGGVIYHENGSYFGLHGFNFLACSVSTINRITQCILMHMCKAGEGGGQKMFRHRVSKYIYFEWISFTARPGVVRVVLGKIDVYLECVTLSVVDIAADPRWGSVGRLKIYLLKRESSTVTAWTVQRMKECQQSQEAASYRQSSELNKSTGRMMKFPSKVCPSKSSI